MAVKPTYEELEQRVKNVEQEILMLKQREKSLRESEYNFQTHLQNTPIGAITWDTDFRVFEWNPAAEAIFGYSKKEALGKHPTDLILPKEIMEEIDDVFKDLISEKGGIRSTNSNLTKSGRRIICDWYNTTLKDTDGNVIGVASLVNDITERKQAEEALQEKEARLKALSEAPFEAIFLSDKGICLEQNLAAQKMFGYTFTEAIGRHGTEWIAPEDRDIVKSNLLEGYEKPYEVAALRKDGTTFPCEIQARMSHFKGRPIRITALRDITEQKKSDQITNILFSISNAVNTTENLDELYQSIYDALNGVLKIPNFYICLVDEKNKIMQFPFYFDEQDPHFSQKVVNYDENNKFITLEVVNQKKTIHLTERDLKQRKIDNKITGTVPVVWLGVPLLIRGNVIGVIAVQHYSDPYYFSSDDIKLFINASEQIALAIDRKRSQEIIFKQKENLEKKIEEIETLQGILPICSSCKKIRDDQGYWNILESYIQKHSDASFSHGICPECSDKLYGDEEWYIEIKKNQNKND